MWGPTSPPSQPTRGELSFTLAVGSMCECGGIVLMLPSSLLPSSLVQSVFSEPQFLLLSFLAEELRQANG